MRPVVLAAAALSTCLPVIERPVTAPQVIDQVRGNVNKDRALKAAYEALSIDP